MTLKLRYVEDRFRLLHANSLSQVNYYLATSTDFGFGIKEAGEIEKQKEIWVLFPYVCGIFAEDFRDVGNTILLW